MRIYIAGPMTGKPSYNVAAFEQAAALFASLQYEPHIPFESNSEVWQRHFGRPFNPHVDTCDYGDPILKEMVAEDIKLLTTCEGIALLPGWERSRGSAVEIMLANNLRMSVFDAVTGLFREVSLLTSFQWENSNNG